jgi:hypothetical protein
MSVVRREYKTLNRDIFALTFGHHDIPPMAQQMSKKRMRLNYKQYLACNGGASFSNLSNDEQGDGFLLFLFWVVVDVRLKLSL